MCASERFSIFQRAADLESRAICSRALPRLFTRQFGISNNDRCPQGHRQERTVSLSGEVLHTVMHYKGRHFEYALECF